MLIEGRGGERDLTASRRCFEKACEGRHGKACNNLGLLLRDGNGGTKNEQRAAEMFDRACALNNGPSCALLGALRLSEGGRQQGESARVALKKACRLGVEEACFSFGVMSEKGAGGGVDPVSAWWGFHSGCRRGHRESCGRLKDVAFNPRQVNESACEQKNGEACLFVAQMADDGHFGPRDRGEARQRYKAACDLGVGEACNSAGEMWLKGIGGEVHTERAKWYLRRACKSGAVSGCANLALLAEWEGDLPKARAVREQACEQRDASSCARLAWFWSWGWGGKRDAAVAARYEKKACRLGDEEACRQRQWRRR